METNTTSTITVMPWPTGSDDSISGIIGSTVPGSSRVVALLSIVPVLLAILGLLVRCYVSSKNQNQNTRQLKLNHAGWKPTSLQGPTQLIFLGFIIMFIILLESASLALPERQASEAALSATYMSEATSPMSYIAEAPLTTDILARTGPHGFLANSTNSTSIASSPISVPGPSTGWLMTLTITPSALPQGTGWLSTPTPLGPTTPPPVVGWLSLDEDGWLSPGLAYFIGTFLPTLLASIFSIPWKILDLDTKSLEPFGQLARLGGGRASQTLLLQYNGISGLFSALMALFTGHSAVALSTLLKYSSALLIPLAAESVRLTLEGECLQDWTKHCTATLQASDNVIRTAQVLLSVMACAVIAYLVLLHGRSFGVASDPRSILGIATLSLNPYLTTIMCSISPGSDGMFSARKASEALGERKFEFGYVTYPSGEQEYGIIVTRDDAVAQSMTPRKPEVGNPNQTSDHPPGEVGRRARKRSVGFWTHVKVVGFAIFVLCLMILILYYRLTYEDTGFEKFMDSQSPFGVRFLFTVFGVISEFGWSSIFSGK